MILTLPALRSLRQALESGELSRGLIDLAEGMGATCARTRYGIKKRPWTLTIEVRRR